jgi:hypothetical protein
MNTRLREKIGLTRYRAFATLERGIDFQDPALLGFFTTACEAVFGLMEGSNLHYEESIRWRTNSPAKVDIRLQSDEEKTHLRIDARMFKFWHFIIYIFIFAIVWSIFGNVMYALGFRLIDPLVTPELFVLVSAARFGSIGVCILIVDLILGIRRKRAIRASCSRLVSALEGFLELRETKDDPTIPRSKLIDLIPETAGGLDVADLHFTTSTGWRINPEMNDSEKIELIKTIRDAGFAEGTVVYPIAIQTFQSKGYILRTGDKIRISLTPRNDGTQIDFHSDLGGFAPLMTLFTTVIIMVIGALLISYFWVIPFRTTRGVGDIIEKLFWVSLFGSSLVWGTVRSVILSQRRKAIERGALRLVKSLEEKAGESD